MGKLKIKFGEIEFEIEGDNEIIDRERKQFELLLPQTLSAISGLKIIESVNPKQVIESPAPSEYISNDLNPKRNSTQSIASFLKEKSFGNDTDLVLGVAYFIDVTENASSFNSKDIENKFSESRHQKPSNISHSINLKRFY
jgi:hypothetical protein